MNKNFISVSRAIEKGNNVIVYGIRESGLYKMNVKPLTASINAVVAELIKIWHERIGHVNYKTFTEMVNNKMVNGLSV